jgi:hypothetical protein
MGDRPAGILITDFNEDGIPDLACGAVGDGAVSVRYGMGGGRFAELRTLHVEGGPRLLISVDWDLDGVPDVLAADDYLHVVPGIAGGGLGKAVDCAISLSHHGKGGFAPPPLVADFDRDGRWDLAVGNGILFGMHECNFVSRSDVDDWWPLATGDFDGDGLSDLVALTNQRVVLMTANGTTRLDGPTPLAQFDGQMDSGAAVVGDLNGDGRLDMVVSGLSGVGVLLNTCR